MTYTTGLSLIEIITENEESPKAIIMAGGAGSGKTYLAGKLGLQSLPKINPDKYVEDRTSPAYNNLSKGVQIADQELQVRASKKERIVIDTTASGKTFNDKLKLLEKNGYEVFMVMTYTHPFISYLSNATRERKIPTTAVFSTWKNSYDRVRSFKEQFGDNFTVFINDRGGKYEKEIRAFNKAAEQGPEAIKEFIAEFEEKNNIRKGSTFFKPVELTDEEQAEFNKLVKDIDYDRDNRSEDKAIKQRFKQLKGRGKQVKKEDLEKERDKFRKTKEDRDKKADTVYNVIAYMLKSRDFKELIQHTSIEEIDNKIQNFFK